MNIFIKKLEPEFTPETGGECGILTLEIQVDTTLPIRQQRLLVLHALIENFANSWTHAKVDEFTTLIEEGLDELEEIQ